MLVRNSLLALTVCSSLAVAQDRPGQRPAVPAPEVPAPPLLMVEGTVATFDVARASGVAKDRRRSCWTSEEPTDWPTRRRRTRRSNAPHGETRSVCRRRWNGPRRSISSGCGTTSGPTSGTTPRRNISISSPVSNPSNPPASTSRVEIDTCSYSGCMPRTPIRRGSLESRSPRSRPASRSRAAGRSSASGNIATPSTPFGSISGSPRKRRSCRIGQSSTGSRRSSKRPTSGWRTTQGPPNPSRRSSPRCRPRPIC